MHGLKVKEQQRSDNGLVIFQVFQNKFAIMLGDVRNESNAFCNFLGNHFIHEIFLLNPQFLESIFVAKFSFDSKKAEFKKKD